MDANSCGKAPKRSESLGVFWQTINEILRERRTMTSLMVLRLARLFGNTPEFNGKPKTLSYYDCKLCHFMVIIST